MDEVRRGTADGVDAEVTHEHDLTAGVAAGGGNHSCSQILGTVMGAQTAGEESVTVGDLNDVRVGKSAVCHGTVDNFGPDLEVLFGVGDDDGFAGGSA